MEVMISNKVARFLWPTVYIASSWQTSYMNLMHLEVTNWGSKRLLNKTP